MSAVHSSFPSNFPLLFLPGVCAAAREDTGVSADRAASSVHHADLRSPDRGHAVPLGREPDRAGHRLAVIETMRSGKTKYPEQVTDDLTVRVR